MHRRALLATAALLPAAAARAQQPARALHIIVPFPPGGGVDIVARLLAEPLRAALGQPIIVENRAGAAGQIGAMAVVRAPADGNTLLLCSSGEVAVAPHLQGARLGYDPTRDLAPVTLVTRIPNVLIVNPRVPARTTAELIALAKAQPGRLTFSSSGTGNLQHLNGELFNRLAGIETIHVPYRGTAPALADVAGGQVTMTFGSLAAALPLIRGDAVRALAVTSRTRMAALPQVPSLAETLPDYELVNWFGLFAPAGTPPERIAAINGAIAGALRDPTLAAKLLDQGAEAAPLPPGEFTRFVASESEKFGRIIRDGNIRAED
jgi:tripartite-type tricarboxylate transporter receptor subunit TctC